MELLIIWSSLVIVTLLLILALFLAIIAIFGPPFVPTPQKTVNEILKKLNLKKGMVFYDLGCGDGRVVRSAVKHYGVIGIGVDLNPFLITYCRLVVWLQNTLHHVIPAYAGIYKDKKLYRFQIKSGMTRKSLLDEEKTQSGNIQFLCQSFFKTDLSNAEIIYMYPVPMVIPKLVKKFETECKKGTVIVSYCFEIKGWKSKLIEEALVNRKSVFFYKL